MLNNVVIICDGKFPKTEYPRYLLRYADFIICCDGALVKFLRNSKSVFGEDRLPDLVIGDMDTLSAKYTLEKFEDFNNVSAWAITSMGYCVKDGILVGENTINPKENVTREMIAVMVYRMLGKAKLL